jgi:hypothetical protein
MTLAERLLGHNRNINSKICYGPRLAFSILLNYMKRVADSLGDLRGYFQLTWATSLFHDKLNYPMVGDSSLVSALKWFKRNGHLQNTVLLLLSDHGMPYGKIRKLDQVGRIKRSKCAKEGWPKFDVKSSNVNPGTVFQVFAQYPDPGALFLRISWEH